MPTLTDHIAVNKTIPHLERPKSTIDVHANVPHIVTLELSWGVYDLQTNETVVFDADGGHFKSLSGHRYLVFLRATDIHGIQKITLDGSGMFHCSTEPDKDLIFHEAVSLLHASIPHAEFVNRGVAPTLQSLVVVMKPDIGAFDYFKLSGGFHTFNGTSESLEYFAFSGLMTFSATAIDSRGDRVTATLTTAP